MKTVHSTMCFCSEGKFPYSPIHVAQQCCDSSMLPRPSPLYRSSSSSAIYSVGYAATAAELTVLQVTYTVVLESRQYYKFGQLSCGGEYKLI